jgi:hypothetical protein
MFVRNAVGLRFFWVTSGPVQNNWISSIAL